MSAHLVIMVKKLFQFECIFLCHLLLATVVTAKNHYLELCKENCTSVDCKPSQEDFTEVFTPNCGVELPTFSTINGHIVGCQSKYLEPLLAFPHVLVIDKKSLSLLRNKSHTKVGVGMVGFRKKSFWRVLFSSGQTNSTFVLEAHGIGIKQKKGCYSGSSLPCNGDQKTSTAVLFFSTISLTLTYIFLLQQS